MKVLFAVNNENISESIIKKYQQEYKEIISVKNVYYFNAIIKELQRDKTYDRIVISEDLQPFSNNNYDAIDKFIFEKMDNISDEATNQSGDNIPIILICTDRRTKSEPLLVKLFGIGLYDALLGKDRSITNVCELLARPRSKKEAKVYYHIDSEDVDYKVENEEDVTEVEIQSIINHYKKLGGNEQKYVESFDHIASQYTDAQLRLIAKFLPLNVKAVLEASSPKYQEVVSFGEKVPNRTIKPIQKENRREKNIETIKQKDETQNIELIQNNLNRNKITEPVIIPTAIDTAKVKRMQEQKETQQIKNNSMPQTQVQQPMASVKPVKVEQVQEIDDILEGLPTNEEINASINNQPNVQNAPINNRPNVQNTQINNEPNMQNAPINNQPNVQDAQINNKPNMQNVSIEQVAQTEPKRGRGRPRKPQPEGVVSVPTVKRGRGRPRKVTPDVVSPNEQTSILDEFESIGPNTLNTQNIQNAQNASNAQNTQNGQNILNDQNVLNGQNNNIVQPNNEEQNDILNDLQPIETKTTNQNTSPINLFELGEDDDIDEMPRVAQTQNNDFVLPGLDDEPIIDNQTESNKIQGGIELDSDFGEIQNQNNEVTSNEVINNNQIKNAQQPFENNMQVNNQNPMASNQMQSNSQSSMVNNPMENNSQNLMVNTQKEGNSQNLNGLLTREKKVVAFVGTSKNGTSFLVNNVAEMLSQKGINTAILDLTKNRNAYYIFTENEEPLRKIAYSCIENLRSGKPEGIQVHKNLTVYTALPDEEQNINDYTNILQTLVQNYSLVILDCDYETDIGYFKEAQELYLVQSFDILTIQPLTAFLRNLKAKNVLEQEKLRLVLNKAVKLKSISEKTIIGGMAFYNDPSMSFMTELFNRETVVHCTIPFEEQTYAKYLDGLVNCKISLNGYSKVFMASLSKLSDMVYPLINNNKGNVKNNNNYNKFSNSMNNTLDKMKNNY